MEKGIKKKQFLNAILRLKQIELLELFSKLSLFLEENP